jgi:stress-induced morphogen
MRPLAEARRRQELAGAVAAALQVYTLLDQEIKDCMHALSMATKTPEEAP